MPSGNTSSFGGALLTSGGGVPPAGSSKHVPAPTANNFRPGILVFTFSSPSPLQHACVLENSFALRNVMLTHLPNSPLMVTVSPGSTSPDFASPLPLVLLSS